MHRKLLKIVLIAAAIVAVGGMACIDTAIELDKVDETEGAT